MGDFVNYEIKSVSDHWAFGSFWLYGVPTGWSVYPITYGDKQYVVELKICSSTPKGITEVVACIYDYGKENKLFKKHKRDKVFSECVSSMIADLLEAETRISEQEKRISRRENWLLILPQIMNNLFQRYELEKQRNEAHQEILANVERWDAIIDK
ncbi:hypothetical protein OBV_p-00580 (plasmid) [Oscillibacter valericigenes Sjm18-20]|nr:hypothetical protein OBV_p-00580 [Oscillibacter valericigenes Sjm18-20]